MMGWEWDGVETVGGRKVQVLMVGVMLLVGVNGLVVGGDL